MILHSLAPNLSKFGCNWSTLKCYIRINRLFRKINQQHLIWNNEIYGHSRISRQIAQVIIQFYRGELRYLCFALLAKVSC